MASAQDEVERSDVQLKNLGFVRVLAINAVVVVSSLYDYVKQNSGPLKSAVGSVENAVTAVIGPVYDKFKGVPDDILVFMDRKADVATQKFAESASPAAKVAVSKAQLIIVKASQLAQDLVKEGQAAGPLAAISHRGTILKQFSVNQLVIVWYKVKQYPASRGVFEVAATSAAQWSQRYNKLVKEASAKGYSLFKYVPLVPVEEIEKAYKQVEAGANKKDGTASSSGSDSDKE